MCMQISASPSATPFAFRTHLSTTEGSNEVKPAKDGPENHISDREGAGKLNMGAPASFPQAHAATIPASRDHPDPTRFYLDSGCTQHMVNVPAHMFSN
jgi:hypothetical protein